MKINQICLKNYRNFEIQTFYFFDGLNVLVGENGTGKTNVLEAINILSSGRSNKTTMLTNTIMNTKKESEINGEFYDENRKISVKVLISNNNKKVFLDGKIKNKSSLFFCTIDAVPFSIDDYIKFMGSPAERRKLFDFLISKLDLEYLLMLKEYNSLIKEKNNVLKNKTELINIHINSLLDVIDLKLFDLNRKIYSKRKSFVETLNFILLQLHDSGFEGTDLYNVCYVSEEKIINDFEEFKSRRNFDLKLLSSSAGIHKDDFRIIYGNKDICIYGSQGQIKLALILLKLAYAKIIYRIKGTSPILLFDDVLGDLDNDKQTTLLKYLNKGWQAIISTPSIVGLDKEIVEKAHIIKMKGGKR